MNARDSQTPSSEQPIGQSYFHLYSDGFGLGNRNWRVSNILPNVRSLTQTTVALAASAVSLIDQAQALDCGRFDTVVNAFSYFKDVKGTNYQISRQGCNTPVGEGSFSISELNEQCDANITFPKDDIAANYIELANYYYNTIQLGIGAGEISNTTLVACAKEYLAALEANLIAQDNKASSESIITVLAVLGGGIGTFLLVCGGFFLVHIGLKHCRKERDLAPRQDRTLHASLPDDIEANLPQKNVTNTSELTTSSKASSPRFFKDESSAAPSAIVPDSKQDTLTPTKS